MDREEDIVKQRSKKIRGSGPQDAARKAQIAKLGTLTKMDPGELLSGMNLILRALQIKGYKIQDWENKKRILKEIRPLYQKIYFFAGEPEKGGEDDHGN